MDCDICNNRAICHMYFKIKKYNKYANINISNCKFFSLMNTSSNTNTITVSNTNSNINSNETIFKNKDYDKIKKLSLENSEKKTNMNRDLALDEFNKEPQIRTFVAKPLQLDTACPTCKALTFKEDIVICSQCQKQICSCCATYNGTSILCEECWNKN